MIYRDYGKTGKKISAIGFGGMRFDNPEDYDFSAEMLLYALENGISYFDTAPFYFGEKSEEIFGHARAEMLKTEKSFIFQPRHGKEYYRCPKRP